MRRRLAATMAGVALLAAGCGLGPTADGALRVVVTTTPLGDLVRTIVGEDGAVEVLFPIGADAHSYQPSSRQIAEIQSADLVVANGLDLEEGLGDVLESAAADGANVFMVAPLLDPLPFPGAGECDPAAEHEGEHEGDGHEHGACDPHVWHDPLRMAHAARLVAAELAAVAPNIDWAQRAEAYAAELEATDADIAQILAAVPAERRKLVTNHEAFGYFADRYGFTVVGVVIPGGSTLADPSAAEIAELVETIEREQVPAIFAETTEPAALAEAIAAEAGDVAVVELYSGSLGEPDSDAATLIGMLTSNARAVAAALS